MLHVLLLCALPFLAEGQRRIPARLTARMAAPQPPEPVAPRLETLPPQPRPAVSRPAPILDAAPQPAVVPHAARTPIPGAEPAKPAAETTLVVPSTPQVAVPRADLQPAVQAASGPDPGTVARFRLELMDVARRYKKYPRIAQDNNWEGRVELRIAIGEDGAISALSVKKGAGRAVLDEEAQAMIRAAQAKAALPPGLRGKAFSLEIPVDFFLKDEEK